MIFTTTEKVTGREISESLGLVMGNVVQSKHIGRDIAAGLKGIIGGELSGYTEMLTDARNKSIDKLVAEANDKGADAVVCIRFTTSAITVGCSEILVYGTAVKLKS